VSAPVANAAAAADSKFYIGTTNSITPIADASDLANLRSTGLLASVTTNNGTTQTAVLLNTGTLSVTAGGLTNTKNSIVVTGGIVVATGEESNGATSINNSRTEVVAAANDKILAALVRPNAGVTTMVVESYQGGSVAAGDATNGTLIGRVTVTVVSSDQTGTLSTANSSVWWNDGTNAATATTDATASNYTKANTESVNLSIVMLDAYKLPINAASGFISASVTGGGKIALGTSIAPSTSSSTSVAYLAHSGLTNGIMYAKVSQGTANAPVNGIVTIKYNDTVLATKSFVITGTVAKFTVGSTIAIGRTGATSADSFTATFADSAGNTVVPANQTTAVTQVSSTVNVSVTSPRITTASTATAAAKGDFTCSGTAGAGVTGGATAKLQLQILDDSAKAVLSNEFTAICGGDPAAFTASLDKASYTPGSIATLTFKFVDSKGNNANDYTSFAPTNAVTYVGAPGTVVAAAATTQKSTNGVYTYQFVVGSVEGDFTMVADAPDVRTANVAAGGTQSRITIPYSIKSSVGTVTNAEVLKSIVALIASINKQIQALQKLILARR
jgi:hypothetical protein